MKLLSILALVAIGAKAHWNDREPSFIMQQTVKYDADTEAKLASERQANNRIISGRKDSEAELFKGINDLLDDLITHIGEEKDSAAEQAKAERKTNADSKKKENDAARDEQKEALDILSNEVKKTTKANDDARDVHATAEERLAKGTAEKGLADKQKDTAKSMYDVGTAKADTLEKKCHQAAGVQLARIHAAIDKQVKADIGYLDEGRAVVKDVTDLLEEKASGAGAGTGSRFPSMLSMEQRLALNELKMRYVAEDRNDQNIDMIFNLLKVITNSINDEEKNVLAKAKLDKEKATGDASDEKTKCTGQKESAYTFLGDLDDKASTRQVAADAEFALAVQGEADTRGEEAKTDAAQKAAEKELKDQTPILQAARDLRDGIEQERFSVESDRIGDKLEGANTYLSGEIATIGNIRNVISGVGGAKAGANALMQVANRMVRSFLGKYVTDISKQSNLRGKINGILSGVENKTNADKISADARKSDLDKENEALKKKLETEADGRLKATEENHTKLVSGAQEVNDAMLKVLNQAKANSQSALNAKSAQKAILNAAKAERVRVLPILAHAKVDAESTADQTFGRDNGFATSKKDASLKYLNEETEVVQEIRTALEGLNKPVGELLQDASVTGAQRSSLIQLIQLSGKYDNAAREGYQGSSHTQKQRIEDLLQEIENKLEAEKLKVGQTFDDDTKEILDDKKEAYKNAKKIHDDGVTEQNNSVDKEQKESDRLCGEHDARLGEQGDAQVNYNDAAGKLSAAQQTQKSEVAAAKSERLNDYKQADEFFTERASTINEETNAEKARLDDTIKAVQKVRTLVDTMNFTVSLIQRYDEDRKSYRDTNATSLANKVLILLDNLDGQCDAELGRCSDEYIKDTNANDVEKTARDEEAKKIAEGQIKDLQNAVDTARSESKVAGEALKNATAEHLATSLQHNKDMDVRATAESIQELNIPTFEADFEVTSSIAADVFDEEREIIVGKANLTHFYLTEEVRHLKAISNMLSELDILTTSNPHSIGQDGYGNRPDFSIENNAANWGDRHSEDYQRERDEGENTDTVSENIADHELTAKRGEAQHFDSNGEKVLLEEPSNGTESIVGQTSVGSAIREIMSWVEKEAKFNADRKASEIEAATERSENLVIYAKNIMKTLKAKDEDRRVVAQNKEDISGADLKAKSTVKDAAQIDNTVKAATLADALATQAKYTPKIEKMLKESLGENSDAHEQAGTDIKSKSDKCKALLGEEKNLLAAVKAKVEEKLGLKGKAALIALVSKMATRSLARLVRYDFSVKKGQSFEDKQDGDYLTKGATEEYTAGIGKLNDLIAKIRSKDEALLKTVDAQYYAEKGEFDTERNVEIKRSEEELKALLATLADIVVGATGERDVAEKNRAAQEIVRVTAEGDYEAKSGALQAAKILEAMEVSQGSQLSKGEISDANSAFTTETELYAGLLKTGTELLTKEVTLIGKISAALDGKGFSVKDKPVHAKLNTCATEKSASDSATAKVAVISQDCSKFNILEAGGDEANASEDESKACAALPAAHKASTNAADTYSACISQEASFLSTAEAEAALVQLGEKYIGKDFDYEGAKVLLKQQLNKILAKLTTERNALEVQYKADLASSTKKRDDEIARSEKVLADLVQKHVDLVAAAQKLRDDAFGVQTTEQALYAKLLGISNDKQAKFEEALKHQQTKGDAGKIVNQNSVDAANTRYTNNAARILNLKEIDTEYLTDELAAVSTIESIMFELGITDEE